MKARWFAAGLVSAYAASFLAVVVALWVVDPAHAHPFRDRKRRHVRSVP